MSFSAWLQLLTVHKCGCMCMQANTREWDLSVFVCNDCKQANCLHKRFNRIPMQIQLNFISVLLMPPYDAVAQQKPNDCHSVETASEMLMPYVWEKGRVAVDRRVEFPAEISIRQGPKKWQTDRETDRQTQQASKQPGK